jgi:hypothetical protein
MRSVRFGSNALVGMDGRTLLKRLRASMKTHHTKRCRLDDLPNDIHVHTWLRQYVNLLVFKKRFSRWPRPTETFPGRLQIGQWLYRARQEDEANCLSPWKKRLLKACGYNFPPVRSLNGKWDYQHDALVQYRKMHPDRWPSNSELFPAGNRLGRWVEIQRQRYTRGTLEGDQLQKLRDIGLPLWKIVKHKDRWVLMYSRLLDFRRKNPDSWPSHHESRREVRDLGDWCHRMRSLNKKGRLSKDRCRLLEKVGFEWAVLDAAWNRSFQKYRGFLRSHHGAQPSAKSTNSQERKIAVWYQFQRLKHRRGRLGAHRAELFVGIPMKSKRAKSFWLESS